MHAPDCVLVYESGAIGAKPVRLPLSIGDDDLAETAQELVSVPEIFNYWVGAGRIDVGFLGAAQIDRYGNINTTVIGPYEEPKVRLPGAGGAPEIAAASREVYVLLRHSKRAFVEQIDFVTSVGHRVNGRKRADMGWIGKGPTVVITDMGVLRPSPEDSELELVALHPGVELDDVRETPPAGTCASATRSRRPSLRPTRSSTPCASCAPARRRQSTSTGQLCPKGHSQEPPSLVTVGTCDVRRSSSR